MLQSYQELILSILVVVFTLLTYYTLSRVYTSIPNLELEPAPLDKALVAVLCISMLLPAYAYLYNKINLLNSITISWLIFGLGVGALKWYYRLSHIKNRNVEKRVLVFGGVIVLSTIIDLVINNHLIYLLWRAI